jgi:hypothetical protein
MSIEFADFFSIYEFPTGRRLHTYEQMRKRAESMGENEIVTFIDDAIAKDRQTMTLEADWSRHKNKPGDNRARAIDLEIDKLLSGIDGFLSSWADLLGPDQQRSQYATQIRTTFFPDGLLPIINANYPTELAHLERMIDAGTGPLAEAIAALDMGGPLQKLQELRDAFRDALDVPEPSMNWADVRAARQDGQRRLLGLLAHVLGKYNLSTEAHNDARRQLLAPLEYHQGQIAESYRRRRPVRDVDPQTGEETFEPVADDVA